MADKAKFFDVMHERELLLDDVGGYEWALDRDVDKVRSVGGLSSSARFNLGLAIQCVLVGFDEPANRLLERARYLATESLTSDHEIAGWLTYESLALCEWILNNRHDEHLCQLLTEDRSLTTSGVGNDPVNVSMSLPSFVDAGVYEQVLELVERTKKLKEPENINRIRSEGPMCLVIARHRLGQKYTEEEVANACAKFMSRSIGPWLWNGHYVRAAVWMKIIFWNCSDQEISARDTILKCLDYVKVLGPKK